MMEIAGSPHNYYFPPYITLASISHGSAGCETSRKLKQYQLHYTVSGSITCEMDGCTYTSQPGDLFLQEPGKRIAVRSSNARPFVYMFLAFHFGNSQFPLTSLLDKGYLGNHFNSPIEKGIYELVMHYRQEGLSNQLRCQQLLMQILYEAHKANEEKPLKAASNQKVVSKMILIKNYLADHYKENIKIKHLESISGLSKNYISVQFKKLFNMQPMQYLIWLRIEKAKELAMKTDLSFSEIATEVGYSDIHTFGKTFKRKTGVSLSQFCSTVEDS